MQDGLGVVPPLAATQQAADFDPTTTTNAWYNLTALARAVNVTRYAPLFEDVVMAGPRIVMKLGSFMTAPNSLALSAQDVVASATESDAEMLRPLTTDSSLYSNIMNVASAPSSQVGGSSAQAPFLSLDGVRGLGSVFGYATSKWALSCLAMAVILNRTHIFAATRRRLRLRWQVRLVLRIVPVVLLVLQARTVLQSIQCQTSPDFALLRWGDANKSSDLMFSHSNTFLNTISSTLLFGATDEQSCVAAQMVPSPDPDAPRELRGSLSRLWPQFGTYCLSQFLETISCAVQGRSVAAETGMTLFEQSLAFAEADAAVNSQLGWGAFSKYQSPIPASLSQGGTVVMTRAAILRRVNTSPEVLWIAFLSSMTHITSHVLGIFDLQAKYRLASTAFWGLCYMGSLVWSFITFEAENPATQGFFRFPTVCIIGFIPHVLILIGIIMCLFVYGLALLLTAVMPPASQENSGMTFRQRLFRAHENMQANVSLSELRITREMDFYTALLRTGFAAITMASEAVYLNEDRGVSMKRQTWLEEARYREAEELRRHWISMGLSDPRYDQIGTVGLIPVKDGPLLPPNGYSRERAAQKVPRGRGDKVIRVGIGASERSSRWVLAVEFLIAINKLLGRVFALSVLWLLSVLRIQARPAWLLWLASRTKGNGSDEASAQKSRSGGSRDATTKPTDGDASLRMDALDIEAEFRRVDTSQDEETLDGDLYKYWLKGGWWGSNDMSGTYQPSQDDEDWDNTSVITMTTNGGDTEDEGGGGYSSEEGSGQRTPTQRSPQPSRESTPFLDSPLAMSDLARLLHPTSLEERQDAERLAAHLQSDRILTRSGFRRMEQLQRTRILTVQSPKAKQPKKLGPQGRLTKLSPEEEEHLLEQLIWTKRQGTPTNDDDQRDIRGSESPSYPAEGESPPCVVCQCSPRTVIVWPCRCLSLCDDCRVSLAMNNFDKCVCCRRDVMSFSRIYVP
ncbi:hypothetical protein M419DRAFT_95114 [Trichoderma reesei RUT C-30]|jgi:hypothetical protein|uniref:Ubiquitin-protein ligase n=1 Tax=Hypocrea jecorina (strain ATCC 56765 / BCRC 32924 / NRRL 11460 / Rut C-30) TaxID=1344414 RepID=A0A024SH55_HYPJR|nr:hypothetical protein M419DRAFT_95114 [Trichoderma reesei RUT C-30]